MSHTKNAGTREVDPTQNHERDHKAGYPELTNKINKSQYNIMNKKSRTNEKKRKTNTPQANKPCILELARYLHSDLVLQDFWALIHVILDASDDSGAPKSCRDLTSASGHGRTPSEHPNPHYRLKGVVHLSQNHTIGFEPWPSESRASWV